jgi:hypothetical protein
MPVKQGDKYILNSTEYAKCNYIPPARTAPTRPPVKNVGGYNPNTPVQPYYSDVEQQTIYTGKLLADEQQYFISKYGTDIYSQLIEKRKAFVVNNTTAPDVFIDNSYSKILETIHELNDDISNKSVYHYLDLYLPSFNANSTYKQIEYKHEEFKWLLNINFYINLLYYILFIILILLLASSDNLYLKDRFIIYIFLAILPFLYPWLFIIVRNIWKYVFPDKDYGGPTQMDTNINTITMFSNNVKSIKTI